jgi:hypothetical protein
MQRIGGNALKHRSIGSIAAAVGVVCSVALLPITLAGASASSGTAIRQAARTSHAASPSALAAVTPAGRTSHAMLPANASVGNRAAKAGTGANAPRAAADTVVGGTSTQATPGVTSGKVIQKFNGVSDVTQTRVSGFYLTPPDQGLCAGRDPTLPNDPQVVWEPVNEAAAEYSVTGKLMRPVVSLATLFHDPNDYGDVRCLYDAARQSFYFTEINSGGTIYTKTGVDVAVLNRRGWATYVVSTSMTTHCLGDQPKTGFDANALVISTDEYCTLLTATPTYRGAIVIVISKDQLVHESTTVNYWTSTPLSDAGYPVVGLDPAIGAPGGREFMVNSVPYLTNIRTTINPVGTMVGEAVVHNTASVTNGTGAPVVTTSAMTSEDYAFPVRAKSTGTGAATTVTGTAVYSVSSLNSDDSRMSAPVEVTVTNGHVMLWTAICVSLVPDGTSVTRDGVAWFEVDATSHAIAQQGYIAAKHTYLIYPSILAPQTMRTIPVVFTATSPGLDPSAAFTTLGSPKVTVVAHGFGPQMTFDITQGFRWGDYSFAAEGPNGIWMATEYIPPKTDQQKDSNWGSEVFEVRS